MSVNTRIAARAPRAPPTADRLWRWLKERWNLNLLLGMISLVSLGLLWEFAEPLRIPGLRHVPSPSSVIAASGDMLRSEQYRLGWQLSFQRILGGFVIAQIIGIPLGLLMAMNRFSFG